MQCNEFELLLTDALDGVLTGTGLDRLSRPTPGFTRCVVRCSRKLKRAATG